MLELAREKRIEGDLRLYTTSSRRNNIQYECAHSPALEASPFRFAISPYPFWGETPQDI